ncbi:unnamed protein product, partial [Arabidopsis halleri]
GELQFNRRNHGVFRFPEILSRFQAFIDLIVHQSRLDTFINLIVHQSRFDFFSSFVSTMQ